MLNIHPFCLNCFCCNKSILLLLRVCFEDKLCSPELVSKKQPTSIVSGFILQLNFCSSVNIYIFAYAVA